MMDIIDIHSKGEYPANVLSNFYPNEFEFDGVKCASMEGFLQSLKFKNKSRQIKVCSLVGIEAKNAGKRKWLWKITGNVYWNGVKIKRSSTAFTALIMRAYSRLLSNTTFFLALKESKGHEIIHSIGKHDKKKTILTEEEFVGVLKEFRKTISSK